MEIVVFGGTVEGRLLAQAAVKGKQKLHICVATEYGESLLPKEDPLVIYTGPMEEKEMEAFLKEISPAYCLDATHPYAVLVTANIRKACKELNIPYIRIHRREESSGDFICVRSVEEAAAFLKKAQGNILITTGSRELEKYRVIPDYEKRCFVRVLPDVSVIKKCEELGFKGKNLIAMQGPFCEEMNYALLKQTKSAFLVTKNSGKEGGYQEKCEAALRAGANIIVVEKPAEDTGGNTAVISIEEAVSLVQGISGKNLQKKRIVSLIGMGPGNPELLTKEALDAIRESDVLTGAKRMLDIGAAAVDEAKQKPVFCCCRKEEIAGFLKEHTEYLHGAVLYSGDIGFYSGAKGMKELLEDFEVREISGISSPAYFLNRLGISREDVLLLSCHGQKPDLLSLIREHGKVCVLLGEGSQVAGISGELLKARLEKIKITVGERLSYQDERILSGYPCDMAESSFDSLSVALFENPAPEGKRVSGGIRDEEFIRGKVPMTKEEIRALSLSKLKLTETSVMYDVGAGTGSVCVEAALLCKKGQVYAIEKKEEAAELTRENKARFGAENLEVVQGEAPECLKELPAPTHAFVGGSGGRLTEIIVAVREKNPKTRFVINAVTLETMSQLADIGRLFPEYRDMEVIQVNVARSREASCYHLMSAENPVMIVSFGAESSQEERNA